MAAVRNERRNKKQTHRHRYHQSTAPHKVSYHAAICGESYRELEGDSSSVPGWPDGPSFIFDRTVIVGWFMKSVSAANRPELAPIKYWYKVVQIWEALMKRSLTVP